jgi:DNA-binding NarL/FixJ family response regulator
VRQGGPELNALAFVEAAYDLDRSPQAWINAVVDAALPVLDRGAGMFAMVGNDLDPRAPGMAWVVTEPRIAQLSEHFVAGATGAMNDGFIGRTRFSTMRKALRESDPRAMKWWDSVARPFGVRDAIGMMAHDLEGGCFQICALSPRVEHLASDQTRALNRIAAHVGAALRLRRHRDRLDEHVEAVISPAGKIEDAKGAALEPDARLALGESARAMAQARHRGAPMAKWTSMVRARWTLIEQPGRAIVAPINVPTSTGLIELTPRERTVVELARRGHGNKQIAYATGLAVGTVSWNLSMAMRKLGAANRVELIALAGSPSPADVRESLGDGASKAEVEVAVLAIRGASNSEIASARGVTERTVANQLAATFRRCGVRSRAELAAYVRAKRQ